jgi:subtilisin
MKKAFLTLIIALLAIIGISLIGTAYSEESQRDVIIGFHQMPVASEKALIHSEGGVVKHDYHLIPAVSASLPEQAVDNMRKNPRIAYIEDDVILTMTTTDEYWNSWGVSHIGSEMVHKIGIDGAGVKVAVIDTGMDYTHEDLDDNYKGGYDFVFSDPDPFDDSYNSHGTHVAGIIAAERNGIGVVGVAPDASLYAVKVLSGSGHGLASWVIAGIEWAVDNDMDIATMSLSTSKDSQSLRDACQNASDAGVLLVAAAGNTNGGNVTYPAMYDSVIAVTATNLSDQQASFSSIGPEVELAAPGVDIMSTTRGDGSYGYLSGTSQAAPHVAGTAALIISSNLPDINGDGMVNNEDVRLQLRSTAQDLGDSGKDDIYGYGLVDVQAAVFTTHGIQTLTLITRTSGSPTDDVKDVSLSDALYRVTILNSGLSKVKMKVFEGGIVRDDLSSSYHFNGKNTQEVTFNLDVRGTTFDVTFLPKGKPTAFAYIIISKNEVN